MAKTKGEAPTKNKVTPVKVEEITWAKVEEEAYRRSYQSVGPYPLPCGDISQGLPRQGHCLA